MDAGIIRAYYRAVSQSVGKPYRARWLWSGAGKRGSMFRVLSYLAVVGLALHGLIHLMGLVAYWPLGVLAELPYKTALLNGQWEVGALGMRIFALLWLLATIGFLLVALALAFGWAWWQPLLMVTIALSLVITALDWSVAFRGAIIDIVILAALLLLPRLAGWLPVSPAGKF